MLMYRRKEVFVPPPSIVVLELPFDYEPALLDDRESSPDNVARFEGIIHGFDRCRIAVGMDDPSVLVDNLSPSLLHLLRDHEHAHHKVKWFESRNDLRHVELS